MNLIWSISRIIMFVGYLKYMRLDENLPLFDRVLLILDKREAIPI